MPPDTSFQARDGNLPAMSNSAFVGALIVTIFAFIWGTVGSAALSGSLGGVTRAIVVIVTFLYLAGAYRVRAMVKRAASLSAGSTGTTGVNAFRSWQYWLIVVGEVVAIIVVLRALVVTGHKDAVSSALAVIVGLHLIALQPVLRGRRLLSTGVAMTLVALAALALPTTSSFGDIRQGVVGLASALCLWWGAFPLVTRGIAFARPSRAGTSPNDQQ